jgi:DNA-binding response OmpR family regulator
VRQIAGDILQKLGFTVVNAADGHEAIALFGRDPARFTLVLLDLTMPGVSGVETLRQMRVRRPGLPALLMSGYAEIEAETRLAGLNSAPFLQKPFTVASLTAMVRAIFEEPGRAG